MPLCDRVSKIYPVRGKGGRDVFIEEEGHPHFHLDGKDVVCYFNASVPAFREEKRIRPGGQCPRLSMCKCIHSGEAPVETAQMIAVRELKERERKLTEAMNYEGGW